MKRSVKLIAMLLTLVMLLTALPLSAMATVEPDPDTEDSPVVETNATVTAKCYNSKRTKVIGTYSTKVLKGESLTVDSKTFGYYITYGGQKYEMYTIKLGDKTCGGSLTLADGGTHSVEVVYVPHVHHYTTRYDRKMHWDGCNCGKKLNIEYHVDPATDEDSICTCGYKFSDNADLVSLWLANMVLEPRFNKGTTEYNANVHTHKKVTSTEIRVKTFDALATVELPSDLSVEEGMNTFEITVTAEDRKTTKTYTVYAFLPAEVDGMVITSTRSGDEGVTSVAPKAVCKKRVASVTLTEAIGKTMAEQVGQNESSQVVVQPTFSKWANDSLKVTVPAGALKAISETKADFVIKTWQGDVIVPNAELAGLAGQGESIELTVIFKQGDLKCDITADGKEVDNSKLTFK